MPRFISLALALTDFTFTSCSRLLDMLMDINDSPQIPFERRIDLNLEDEEDDETEEKGAKRPMSTRDKRAIILLIILCEWTTYAYRMREY